MEVFEYNGSKISFDFGNGVDMINATEMSKSFYPKKVNGFLRLRQTQDFIKVYEKRCADSRIGNEFKALRVVKGGNPALQGTWMAEKLALKFAAWLSPDFELWVYDRIAELLKTGTTSIQSIRKEEQLSPAQMHLQNALILVDIEEKQKEQDERILKLESKVNTSPDYFTVIGFATLHNLQLGRTKAATLGRRCSSICKTKEYDIGKVNDVRYGLVNSYPSIVLEQVFNDQNLLRKKQS